MALPRSNYKRLLTEKQFLRVAQRARRITGIHIVSIDYNHEEVKVVCNSGTHQGVTWTQRIQLVDLVDHKHFEQVKRDLEEPDKSKRDFAKQAKRAMVQNYKDPILGKSLEKAIQDTPIKVHCNCLAAGTLVRTQRGRIPIETVKSGDEVICSDGTRQPVIAVRASGLKVNWVKLTYGAQELTMTISLDHKVRIREGKETPLRKVVDLKLGDTLYGKEGNLKCCYSLGLIEPQEPQVGYDLVLAKEPHDYLANSVFVSNCPAFLYWGYQYIAWKKGYGLVVEHRRPHVRNPQQRGFLCFPKSVRVLTKKGYVTIDQVQKGDYVYTHKARFKKVLSKATSVQNGLLDVKAMGGPIVTATKDHPFLIRRADQLMWCPADELSEGDLMCVVTGELGESFTFKQVQYVKASKCTHARVYSLQVEEDHSFVAEGFVVKNCKHLYAVLSIWPLLAKAVARKIKIKDPDFR